MNKEKRQQTIDNLWQTKEKDNKFKKQIQQIMRY